MKLLIDLEERGKIGVFGDAEKRRLGCGGTPIIYSLFEVMVPYKERMRSTSLTERK